MTDPRAFAATAHEGQTYNDEPYTVHLEAVARLSDEVADSVCEPEFLRTVAWLHDVVEDTDAARVDVAERFGDQVAEAVSLLSDPPGQNRRERKARLHERLHALDERKKVFRSVLLVKTADRLSNVREAVGKRPSLLKMYRREHAAFRAATHRPGLCDAWWAELDNLLGD